MIRVDCTSNGCVVVCSECPHWYAFRFGREEGWKAAREHEKRAHPGSTQATVALAGYPRRKAGTQ